MTDVSDIVSFAISLVPFLNAGLVILTIDLLLRMAGLEISKGDFSRSPLSNLVLGLGLILISNFAYLLVQGLFPQIPPLVFCFILILIYFSIVLNMTPKKYRKQPSK
jgi:CHASE2 domain-containing sensor protein